jgi:hypothetical protein
LAKHIEGITILPEGEGAMLKYRGEWDVIDNTESAEGQNRTAYAGLFRAALYR